MRLRADQVSAHLDRNGLGTLYFVCGDEPLQVLEITDEIRAFARDRGCAERTVLTVGRGFDWNQLALAGGNMSLFSERQLIELRLGDPKPGREGGAALVQYAENPPEANVLLISAGRIDARTRQTRWFKSLEAAGVLIQVRQVEAAKLPRWIADRVRRAGKSIDPDAAALIAERVEGNLLAARQEIDKLSLLVDGDTINARDVMLSVTDSARFDVFALLAAAFAGDRVRVVRMLRGLRGEGNEMPPLLGAVLWQLRQVCAMAHAVAAGDTINNVMARGRVWDQNREWTRAALRTLDEERVRAIITEAAHIDRASKGAVRADPWQLMERFLCGLGGRRPHPARR